MKCEKFKEIISAFIDSEASPLEQLALQKHLEACGECKRELVLQYRVKNMVREEQSAQKEISLSSSVMERIKRLPLKPRKSTAKSFALSLVSRFSAAAIILAATVATVFYTYSNHINSAAVKDNAEQYTSYIYSHVNEESESAWDGTLAQGSVQDYIVVPERRISTVSLSR
jgi:anti-sigma factor RsiW